jgi:hypothetical protein
MPVTQSKDNEENSEFWKYTPSGEAELKFRGPSFDSRGKEYTPGDYYYIDMVADEDGGWLLATVTYHSEENGEVKLNTRGGKYTADWGEKGFTYGSLQMGIDNPPAFLSFEKAGKPWSVKFTWAEPSDN